jgi:ribosomal protein S18 acetylase RimI-like enzyme
MPLADFFNALLEQSCVQREPVREVGTVVSFSLSSESPVPSNAKGDITIIDIVGDDMVAAVSEIHLQAFSGYLNARLGAGYARALIRWFAQQVQAVALAAIDHDHRVIGYAIGAPASITQKVRHDLYWVTAFSIMLRPWLILDIRLWKVGYARLVKKNDADDSSHGPDLPEPTMSLFGIGVKPSHRRQGVGQQLLRVFEERAKTLGNRSLLLWVYAEKVTTRHLYEKCGWRSCPDSLENTGATKYVRFLDEPPS